MLYFGLAMPIQTGAERIEPKHRRWLLLAMVFVVLAIWLPRGLALDRFVTVDEVLWLSRAANFYYALGQRDFQDTYQSEHPGVTTMWAGTLGMLARYPQYRGSGMGQVNHLAFHRYLGQQSKALPLELLTASRAFLVLGHTLTLALGFWYTVRLIGLTPAFIAFLLIAFDPFHLALTRLLHLDGLLANLMLLSLLAFILFLGRRRPLDLLVSAGAGGLSVLTKSPGALVVPVIGFLTGYELWRAWSSQERAKPIQLLWKSAWPVIAWLVFGAMVIYLFWPALWRDPFQPLFSMFQSAEAYAVGGHDSAVFFNGYVATDGILGWNFFYFYPLTYLWRSSPVVLFGLSIAIIGFFLKKSPFDQTSVRGTVFGLFLFVVVFTMAMTFGSKKFDRYLLPIYAPLDILAALGWVCIATWLKEKSGRYPIPYISTLLLIAVVGFQIFSALRTFPYYLSYYNPLLGGARKAPQVMQIGWGEGLDQAARYLNQKPIPGNLKVVTWYPLGPFSYFFQGHTHQIPIRPISTEQQWSDFLDSDYAVVYIHQGQRGLLSAQLNTYLAQRKPEYTVWINGIEYAQIYALH